MRDQITSQPLTSDPSLIQLGRNLSASLLEGNLDQSIMLLLDHADQTGYRFSEEISNRLEKSLMAQQSHQNHQSAG